MEYHVIQKRRPLIERHIEAVMEIVIKVRSGGHNPIDEACLHERNEAALAQARRRERAGQAHPDEPIIREHFVGE